MSPKLPVGTAKLISCPGPSVTRSQQLT